MDEHKLWVIWRSVGLAESLRLLSARLIATSLAPAPPYQCSASFGIARIGPPGHSNAVQLRA